jgi:hypothetical protein
VLEAWVIAPRAITKMLTTSTTQEGECHDGAYGGKVLSTLLGFSTVWPMWIRKY